MAGAAVPQPEDWEKYKVPSKPDDWSQYAVKKVGGAGSPHTYAPAPQDIATKNSFDALENGFDKLPNGSSPSPPTNLPAGVSTNGIGYTGTQQPFLAPQQQVSNGFRQFNPSQYKEVPNENPVDALKRLNNPVAQQAPIDLTKPHQPVRLLTKEEEEKNSPNVIPMQNLGMQYAIGDPNDPVYQQQKAQDDLQAQQRAQEEQQNPGSWSNALPELSATVGKIGADLGEFGANVSRNVSAILPGGKVSQNDLYQKDLWGADVLNDDGTRQLSPYGKMVDQNGKGDPLGSFIIGMDAYKNETDKNSQLNPLPHTFLGNTASGAIHIAPDIAAVALMPESSEGAGGDLLDALIGAAKNPFTKLQAAKGAISGYNKGGVQGAVEEGVSGGVSGAEMSLLGDFAGKVVSPKIASVLSKTGLATNGKLTAMGSDMLADATVFGAQPIASNLIQGKPIDWNEVQSGVGTGLGFGSLKAFKAYGEHSDEEDKVKDILKNSQGIALKNFMDAAPEAVVQAYKSPDNTADLTAQAMDAAQKTMQETDIEKKKQYAASSSLLAKTAGVKATTEAILNDKDGFIKSIQDSDLPDDQKQQTIDKANQVYKQLDPTEQQKNDLANQIQALQDAPKGDIVAEKEKAIQIKGLNKQLDEIITNQYDHNNDHANGNTVTYSKGIGDDDGKFFKTVNGEKEEITPERYKFEKPPKPVEPIVEQKGENTDAIPVETTGEMGVRDETAVGEGMGGQNQSEIPSAESEQQPNGSSENAQSEESKISVKEVIGKPITYHGEDATLEQDGQTLVAKIKGSNREYELGNVDDIGDKSIKDLGIEHQNSVVDTNDAGNVTVRGKEYVNNYSDPLSAINRDKDGNVVSVNLETPDGEKRAFRGDVAEDIAYQLHLKELNKDNETAGKFEQFAGEHEPTQQSIVAAEDANTAEKATVADNAEVSRKPAREEPEVVIPKKELTLEPNEKKPVNGEGSSAKVNEPYVEPKLTEEDVAHVTTDIQSGKPKTEPEVQEPAEPDNGDVKKTILTKRAYEGEIQPEVKKYLEDKGLTRATFSQEERSKQATAFINKFGEDAAQHAVENGDVDGGMAASILAQLQVRNNRAMAEFPEGSDERDALAKKQADLIATMEKKGYLGGEFNGQLAHEYQNAELDYANVKKQVEDATGKKLTAAQDKKIKDLTDLNTKLKAQLDESEAKLIEASDREFKQDVIKKETNAEKSKRIANKLRSLKINTVNDATLGIPVALYNGAIETTASLIEGGGKIADAIDKGLEHIRDSDWYKNLSASKQQKTEQDFKNKISDASGSTDLVDLQERFVNKTDNKFSPDEARAIWGYLRKTYIDNGVPYKDAISKTSDDLGLSWRQVSDAVTSPKLKRASDEMWKKQADLARNTNGIKNWIGEQTDDPLWKALKKVSGIVRGEKVVGHGGIFVGTHAGMTLFDVPTADKTVKAFFNGWKFAYGNEGDYQRSMEELKNSPNYLIAQRAGLKNNPDQINSEEYQKSQKFLGRLGLAGTRGFNAIKVLRQDLFDYSFNRLTPEEKSDPEVAKSIATLMNLATGASKALDGKLGGAIKEVTFAGGMEASRWQKLFQSPVKAATTAIQVIAHPESATPADRVFARVWARRVGTQLATYTTALLANAAIQNTINPQNKVNIFDPDKPDWLKFKFGDVTIDPTSGMRGTADFIYKLGKIAVESKKELKGEKRISVAGEKIANYTRGKLAPLYGMMAEQYAGDDFNGNILPYRDDKPPKYAHKLTWGEYAWQQAPLPVAEAAQVYYQSALEHGANKHVLRNVLKSFGTAMVSGGTGVRVGEYDANAPENKKKK